MKPSDLTLALNAAVVHLQWLNADRYRGALNLVKQVPVDLEAIGSSSGGDLETRDRRQIGGHSDPTGDAVASSADRQARLTDRAETICESANYIRFMISGGYLFDGSYGTLPHAQADLEWCLRIPHAIEAWKPLSDEDRAQVHHAVQHVYDETAALQCEVEQALRYSATVAGGRPVQQARRTCASCDRAGLSVDIDVDRYAHYCRFCGDYKGSEGRVPPEAACAWAARHGKNPRRDQIDRWIFEESLPAPAQRKRTG